VFINSLASAGVASSVWSALTRTLTNPSGVFSDATRTLTSVNPTQSAFGIVNTSLAAGAIQDLRPAASTMREGCFVFQEASNVVPLIYDGTNSGLVGGTNLNVGFFTFKGNPTVGGAIKNQSAGALNVSYAGFDWT